MTLLALLIGIIAGLRSMTAPALTSWAAFLGWLAVPSRWLSWLANPWAVGLLSLLALGELVTDQLPSTPSRTVPLQFSGRILTGALSGAALTAGKGAWLPGLIGGIVGAIIGTLGGAAVRGRLAARFGSDRPAALLEDCVAIVGAFCIVLAA